MPMSKPIIGITMGDPAGIGPEIIFKALRRPLIRSICRPLVFGTGRLLKDLRLTSHFVLECRLIEHPSEATYKRGSVDVVDMNASRHIRVGKKSVASGAASLAYLNRAIDSALQGEIEALVTGPVSKAAIRQNGESNFIGHTEYLAEKAGRKSVAMMFYSKRIRVALVTTHVPIKNVSAAMNTQKILSVIRLSHDVLVRLGVTRPRIGVAGLNPHAGEERSFGDEDAEIIKPAVTMARRQKMDARGPLPADTLFHAAYNNEYDLVVAMYHDQALVPFKMIAFDSGVNITLGLPFVRTSVDHGTGFDIAGKDVASERSMFEAIKLAAKLARK
jgi:4-hydroxythreonine-4-phosphate dehydrogenase